MPTNKLSFALRSEERTRASAYLSINDHRLTKAEPEGGVDTYLICRDWGVPFTTTDHARNDTPCRV